MITIVLLQYTSLGALQFIAQMLLCDWFSSWVLVKTAKPSVRDWVGNGQGHWRRLEDTGQMDQPFQERPNDVI